VCRNIDILLQAFIRVLTETHYSTQDRQLGLGSGWYKNRQLFTCEPQCGGLVAVAGLILEEDYFYNPDISTSSVSSSPVSEQPEDKRLNVSAVTESSAGHSSPSPSPSSSSSASLDIGLYNNSPNSPVGYHSVSEPRNHQTDFKVCEFREDMSVENAV
jgi:hypothetical protein